MPRRPARPRIGAILVVAALLGGWGCARGPRAAYDVAFDPAHPDSLLVTLALERAPRDTVVLKGHAAKEVLRVGEVEARAGDGTALAVRSGLDTVLVNGRPVDLPRFDVQSPPSRTLVVRYRVRPGSREGDGHVGWTGRCHGYAGKEFVFSAGRGLFLLPQPAETVAAIDVRFDLPEGWSAAVPWERSGDRFRPGARETAPAESLIATAIGLGRWRERALVAGGTTFRFAFESSIAPADEEKALARMGAAARYLHGLFGRDLGGAYLTVIVPRAPTGDEIVGEGWGTGQGRTFVPLTAGRLQKFAEQVIEAYVRHAPHRTEIREPAEFWLVDGVRGLYSWRAVAEAGAVPADEIGRALAIGYLTSLNTHGVQRDLERLYTIEGSRRMEREVLAPLVLASLDHELRQASGGRHTLDAVIGGMFRGRKAPSLWASLPDLPGRDWEKFRTRYARGGADLIPIEPFYRLDPATPAPDPPAGPPVRHLTIAFTGKTDGYLENCGCKVNQSGGVARRATVLARLRRADPDLLLLDAGNAFVRPEKQNDLDFLGRREQELYLKTLDVMGYGASAVSTNELTFGVDHFRAQTRGLATPFLAANVATADGPLAAPSRLVRAGGLRVALVGVFEPPHGAAAPALYEEHVADLTIADPVATLKREVPALRRGADLVIALGRLTPPTIRRVAREVEGLDMVISNEFDAPSYGGDGAHDVHKEDHAGFVGRLLVAYTNLTNYGLYSARLGVDRAGRIATAAFKDHWLYEDVPDHPRIRTLLNRFYDDVGRQAAAQESVPPLFAGDRERLEGRYVGGARCAECHEAEQRQWMTTKHADAYKTLLDRHRHFQPKCISCHVVGYGARHGYRLGAPEQTLANVQCEVCHGPGGGHADAPSAANIRRVVPESVCLECHNPEHSDHFVYAERLLLVRHDIAGEGASAPPASASAKGTPSGH